VHARRQQVAVDEEGLQRPCQRPTTDPAGAGGGQQSGRVGDPGGKDAAEAPEQLGGCGR
jgi:hypothetical protein